MGQDPTSHISTETFSFQSQNQISSEGRGGGRGVIQRNVLIPASKQLLPALQPKSTPKLHPKAAACAQSKARLWAASQSFKSRALSVGLIGNPSN